MGVPTSVEFEFTPSDPDYKITSMSSNGKHARYITATEVEVPAGTPRKIRFDVAAEKPWGAFHSQVLIEGTGKMPDGSSTQHAFTMFANGKTYGTIQADKHIISIGTLQKGGSYNKRVRIFRPDGAAFNVLSTTVTQPTVAGMNATAVQNTDGSYQIIVSGTLPVSHSGPINAQIVVQTDVPGEEVLEFRAAGVVPKR